MIAQLGRKDFESSERSAAQYLDQFLEFEAHLMDQLLALIQIDLGIVARQTIACPADGEALLVQ